MVEHERATDLGRDDQQGQQDGADDDVGSSRSLANVDGASLVLAEIPAVQIDHKDDIVDNSVSNGGLDPRYHRVLLFSGRVFFPGSAVLLDHAHELDVAGHDGGNGGDESGAEEEVGQTGNVKQCRRRAKAAGEEGRTDPDGGQGVEDVKTPGEDVEGDWEVH